MNKKLFLITTIFVIFSSILFAFSNSEYSVDEKGWKIQQKDSDSVIFVPTEFEVSEGGVTPNITIIVKKVNGDKYQVLKHNQKELNDFENSVKNGAFKDYLNMMKSSTFNAVKEKDPSIRGDYSKEKEMKQKIDELYSSQSSLNSSFGKVGSYKAYCVDMQILDLKVKRFVVGTLRQIYIIEITYSDKSDITNYSYYNKFLNSFKAKDSAPTYFNALLYGTIFPYLLKIIIILAIVGISAVFKNKK